jgi:hypothetical protein
MQDRPTIDELLAAVAGFLQDDVMASTTGRLNFHARVSANVLQMIRRELKEQEAHLDKEWDGLSSLLGQTERPRTIAALSTGIEERNRDLSRRIQAGDFDSGPARDRLLAHLRAVSLDKLVVSNPPLADEVSASRK